MSETFCKLPWIHLGTHPQGHVKLCCLANENSIAKDKNGDKLNLSKDSISDIMNSDLYKNTRLQMLRNERPAGCMRCFEDEDNNIISKRQYTNTYGGDAFKSYGSAVSFKSAKQQTQKDGTIPIDLRFVELRLGNLCNLKCRSCHPDSSTSWIKDHLKLYPWDKASNYHMNWPQRKEFWDDLFNSSPNLRCIQITGGEPTLIKEHFDLLEKLVISGRSKNIELIYSVNTSKLPDKLIELWRGFKKVIVSCSIDDLGKRNEYLRHPLKWDTTLKFLDKLRNNMSSNMFIGVVQTISWLNYYYLDEMYIWAKEQDLVLTHNFIHNPKYYSPLALHPTARKHIHNKLKEVLPQDALRYGDPSMTALLEQYDNDIWKIKTFENAMSITTSLDKIRKENVTKTFPELFEINEVQSFAVALGHISAS